MDEVHAGEDSPDQEVHDKDTGPTDEEIFKALREMTPGERLAYEMDIKKYMKRMRRQWRYQQGRK